MEFMEFKYPNAKVKMYLYVAAYVYRCATVCIRRLCACMHMCGWVWECLCVHACVVCVLCMYNIMYMNMHLCDGVCAKY